MMLKQQLNMQVIYYILTEMVYSMELRENMRNIYVNRKGMRIIVR